MVAFQKFDQFVEDLAEQVHDLGADSLKIALSDTAPVAGNSIFGNITEIGAGNGYTAAGDVTAQTGSVQASGTYKLTLTDNVWTASSGTIGPLRYGVLYNDGPTGPVDPLIGFWDRGSSVTVQDGETLTWDQDQGGAGVLTLA